MNGNDREQLAQWVEKQLDDSLTPDDFDQLQSMLMDQPESREMYIDLMHQNAHLKLQRVHNSSGNSLSSAGAKEPLDRFPTTNNKLWLSALIAVAASLLLIAWWNTESADSAADDRFIAQITSSSSAQWGDCSLPTAVGSKLNAGHLSIDRGLATIRFVSGAEVTLESPAELEIESPLTGRLIAGTAVIEVPESAHGFTLRTPTAVAIDHGTAFAVTVDSASHTSSIEVLDGEVEVQHVFTDASLRLKQMQRVVASEKVLSDSAPATGEPDLHGSKRSVPERARSHRITTADGKGCDASVSRGQDFDVQKNSHSELVLIKNPYGGYERFGRKGYFRFDLASVSTTQIRSATFVLTLMPSGLGFASRVGDCDFVVYGLTDESGDDWLEEQLTWQTAPANLEGAAELDASRVRELGRFVVRRGVQHGQVAVGGKQLVEFLNADTNRSVTLILVRETQESEPGGLVHGFTNHSSSVGIPPTLFVNTEGQQDAN